MASARQQIRIAIALAALRHKPPAQSILSYILDLQSAYPVSAPQTDPNRPPSPNPWRQRVLVLEKDLQDLQSQYDKEKIELLALRKAAVSHSKQTKKRTRDTQNAEDTTDAPGRKGRQKRQKPVPVVCATDDAAPSTPDTEPRPQSKPDQGAIARSLFGSDDVPTAPAFLAQLEDFDAMADVLATSTDARAVPLDLDLLLATTRRALRALGALLSACLPCSSSGSSSATGNTFVSTTNTSPHGATSGVREPLRALDLLDASLRRVLCTIFAALPAHLPTEARGPPRATQTQTQTQTQRQAQAEAALDEVLGSLYALVLAPLVRAFAPASEAFVAACLGPGLRSDSRSRSRSNSGFGSGFTFGSGSGSGPGSGISYRGEYPLPGAGGISDSNAACDNDKDHAAGAGAVGAMPDLRPALFDVLERALAVLERQSQSLLGLGLGSSGAEPGSRAEQAGPANARTGPEDGGHICKLGLQAIQGVREVKRLLALDCVRELERMYVPTHASALSTDVGTGTGNGTGTASVASACLRRPSAAESSEDRPGTRTNSGLDTAASIRSRSDVAPGGSADTRQGRGRGTPCHLPAGLALWQGFARGAKETHAYAYASRGGVKRGGGTSEDPTRPSPGTPAPPANNTTTSPALGPPPPRHQIQEYDEGQASGGTPTTTTATRTRWGAGPPRLAGNLGEIRASLGASSDGAALGLEFAHAQGRPEQRESDGERGDRDLRGDDGDSGLGERVVRLARKDTTWYLCAVLNRLLSGAKTATSSSIVAGAGLAAGSSSTANPSSSGSRPGAKDVDIAAPDANPNANANARGNASENPNGPKLSLTNAGTDDTDTIADEAVYAALVNLLRRTRPAQSPSSFLLPPLAGGYARGGGRSDHPSEAARADTAEASIRGDDGSSAGGADRHERQRTHTGSPGGGDPGLGVGTAARPVEMGEVERGMLLAVFERAWLGM